MVTDVTCTVDVIQTNPVVDLVVTPTVTVLLVDKRCIPLLNQDLLVMLVEVLSQQEQRCSLMSIALSVALVMLALTLAAFIILPKLIDRGRHARHF